MLTAFLSVYSVFGFMLYPEFYNLVKTDINDLNLKGKVKTFQENSYYTYLNGKIVRGKPDRIGNEYTLNAQGNIIEQKGYYMADTTLIDHFLFKYDAAGRLLERKHAEDTFGKYYQYNSEGLLTEYYEGYSSEVWNTVRYEYDAEHRLVKKADKDGLNLNIYTYSGDTATEQQYMYGGELGYTTIYIYDRWARVLEKIKLHGGEVQDHTKYEYDTAGHVLAELELLWAGAPGYGEYNIYNSSGKLVQQTSGKLVQQHNMDNTEVYLYTYNEKGDEAGGSHKQPHHSSYFDHTNTYEYDSTGNWVVKYIYVDGKLNMIYERLITYY